MKTAGVVIDNWKLPIFKKHLDGAGYSYTEHPGFTQDAMVLRVQYEWVAKLKPIIDKAMDECKANKPK